MKTTNQEAKPKIVRKPKEKKPIEPEVEAKPLGKVAQIEKMIVEIVNNEPSITRKELIAKCPSEHNLATWNTRIYRLLSKGAITLVKAEKPVKVKAEKTKKTKPSKARVEAPCFI